MKKLQLLFQYCLLCSVAFTQGPQQLVTVPIGPGQTVPAWLYLPADYTTSTKKYPVVFFYHGSGEAGTNPNTVLRNGIPQLIAGGMRPDNIINPVDGQPYSFIVLSAQHWSWSPDPAWLPTEIAWLKQNYRIDTNRIYVTGMSAGGQETFAAAAADPVASKLIAAALPMSPAALGSYDITLINTNHIKTWFLSGATDPFTANAQNYSSQANSVFPGSSKLTIYPGGHCCWRTYYNITWHDTTTGLSIWEWLLTNTRLEQSMSPLAVSFNDFKVTNLGDKTIRVDFSYEHPDGDESFYIQITIKGVVKTIQVLPQDRKAPGKYSKIIKLNQ